MGSSKNLWLLDNGHGGVINNVPQTEGKRSPIWPDGSVLYEGEFARAVVARLAELLTGAGIRYDVITPELADISLSKRVKRANAWYDCQDVRLISIHANAGGGRGYEIFTSPGDTRSDAMAEIFLDAFAAEFPAKRMRTDMTDGDRDKEAEFYVLTKSKMPAILTECFFMDNETECKNLLMTAEGRDRIARAHFKAIQAIEAEGLGG